MQEWGWQETWHLGDEVKREDKEKRKGRLPCGRDRVRESVTSTFPGEIEEERGWRELWISPKRF